MACCFAIAYFLLYLQVIGLDIRLQQRCSHIATIWVCEKFITNKIFQSTVKLASFFTLTIGILPLLKVFSITQDRYINKEWCGKRYEIIEDFAPTTIAVGILWRPDDPMWYHYFGNKWENKFIGEKKTGEYPFIACLMRPEFDFLNHDADFSLINVDSTILENGIERKISLFMNSHPDVIHRT